MGFLNRYFFGVRSGFILVIALLVLGGYLLVKAIPIIVVKRMKSKLFPPEFADPSRITNYGHTDYNWSIRTLNENEISLSEFKGKVIFINFWATWCAPCIAEMPSIQLLYASLKLEDVAFLLISDEDEKKVQDFMKEKKYTFPVFLRGEDLPKVFQESGIPRTYIVNREGGIVFKEVGAVKWDDESCMRFLRRL